MTSNIKNALVELYECYSALYSGGDGGGGGGDGGGIEVPSFCNLQSDDSSVFDLSIAFSETVENEDNIMCKNEVERYLLESIELTAAAACLRVAPLSPSLQREIGREEIASLPFAVTVASHLCRCRCRSPSARHSSPHRCHYRQIQASISQHVMLEELHPTDNEREQTYLVGVDTDLSIGPQFVPLNYEEDDGQQRLDDEVGDDSTVSSQIEREPLREMSDRFEGIVKKEIKNEISAMEHRINRRLTRVKESVAQLVDVRRQVTMFLKKNKIIHTIPEVHNFSTPQHQYDHRGISSSLGGGYDDNDVDGTYGGGVMDDTHGGRDGSHGDGTHGGGVGDGTHGGGGGTHGGGDDIHGGEDVTHALFEEKDFAEASLLSVQVRVHLLVESQSPRQFENHIPSLFLLDPSLLVG
ncbi:hypothetical protein LWI29_004001 [Acer saccharum]|uniref:Uncharacterized protein n=1 Tax=Acer saccharum TaxID=4024 RepID=A0AA39VWK5_ACESA|nr:hypothetical protein LWI29_004001 [Acer saccharum]